SNVLLTTQRYVQRDWPQPPNFYEPLITFAWVAARTERIRLATGIIVLPMRGIPVLAKQVATLDQLSGGRVILGVGTGAYREEYEALFPDAKNVHRGTIVDEGMRALRLLFTERRATFRGTYVHFEEVECFRASQLYRHLESLKNATLREQTGAFEQRNLIGSPEEICERIRIYAEAGVTTLSGMLFVASSVSEMQEAIELFGREVIPN